MRTVTAAQKRAFMQIAERYDLKVFDIIKRGADDEIIIENQAEADILGQFSEKVVELVVRDYPDHTGDYEDINADAEMIVHLTADVLDESGFDV